MGPKDVTFIPFSGLKEEEMSMVRIADISSINLRRKTKYDEDEGATNLIGYKIELGMKSDTWSDLEEVYKDYDEAEKRYDEMVSFVTQ